MSGELKPLERRNIIMTFSPSIPRTMRRVCQVEYEGGEPCSIGVYAEAQNPVVCFLECDKFLPEVYLDVPVVFKAVLHNQTLLPTTFKWGPVEGSQKDDCTVEIQEMEGKIEKYNRYILSEKQGVAFVVYPASGTLQPFGESIIEITAHSNMWGKYNDNLIFNVGYLKTVHIPVSITVVGCPLNFQLTAGQTDHKAVVRFGSHVSGADAITRKLKINNTSPKDIRIDWEMFEDAPESEKLVDFITCFGRAFPPRDSAGNEIVPPSPTYTDSLHVPVNMDLIPNSPDTQPSNSMTSSAMQSHVTSELEEDNPKIISCFLRPHLGDLSTRAFNIKQRQLTVPGNGSSIIDLTFTPLPTKDVPDEANCVGFSLGYLSLDQKDPCEGKVTRPEAYAAELLRLDFTAHLKPALLTVEETDDEGMIYRSAMSDIMKDNLIKPEALRVCSTMLSNNTLTPLTFKLKVKDPWTLVDLDPACTKNSVSRALETLPCTLNPRHNLMVKVAFKVTPSLVVGPPGKTNTSRSMTPEVDSGSKLTFEDLLHIEFDNGAEQAVPLYASLAIPQFELSADILDFGTCLVGQTREQEVTISNMTASHSFWTISLGNKSEFCDNNTFQMQPTEGKLEAHITHISNSKAIIKVFFTAGHSEAYDCTFVVQGLLGEEPRRLHVTGNGSYDGKHEAVLNI
ncbi:deleted in lung and esophageal cancer protein 1 [Elysia marginata]|uniref:Deleted in lung and esophageal cancer protein 1 n=1 Tax=Elysia marginata TaxID=1093978 RepID=A0AAV4GXX5_9GAST|nr:deleted in lung and esophageal cancer protein 1 [Elysia marginata]